MDSDDSISEEEPFDKIDAWFIEPIRTLYKLKNDDSDGAFLAMSASLAMYERFLIKVAQAEGNNTEDNRCIIGGRDLGGIGETNFRIFWGCFRDGLQHQFQPTKKRDGKTYYWSLSSEHDKIPNVVVHSAKDFTIKINPWKFAELVNQRYRDNPQFYEQAKSHKPGEIWSSEYSPDHFSNQLPSNPQPTQKMTCLETGHCRTGS